MTTPMLVSRYDDGTPNDTANCYPPHDTTTRDDGRDDGQDDETGRIDYGMIDGTNRRDARKTGRLYETRDSPKNGTRYEIKREDCYSPSLSESSGKRGKSSNRER